LKLHGRGSHLIRICFAEGLEIESIFFYLLKEIEEEKEKHHVIWMHAFIFVIINCELLL
jgi:hypothetical protein